MNKEELKKEIEKLNISFTQKIEKDLEEYKNLLQEANSKFNLTTIIADEDIYLKHFYDSLTLYKIEEFKNVKYICDFGTGAGFPGLVLKIVFPNIKIDLIESNTKKCEFLSNVIKKLKLKEINVINTRIEEYAKNNREVYDLITCRAVAELRILLELAIPLLKINGYFLPLKANIEREVEESKSTLIVLNSKIKRIEEFNLSTTNYYRTIPVIQKLNKTKKDYPRNYNKILKEKLK